jgi:hypothetical protein
MQIRFRACLECWWERCSATAFDAVAGYLESALWEEYGQGVNAGAHEKTKGGGALVGMSAYASSFIG